LHAVRAFVAVAELGSFSKAAQLLQMTPSCASRLVKTLEQQLGVVLILRTTRALSLTEVGHRFLADSRDGFAQFQMAFERASDSLDQPSGVLKISVPVAFARHYVVPHLAGFLAAYPQVRLELSVTDRYVDVVGEAMSATIRIGRLDDSGLIARKLFANRRIALAAPAYLERHGAPLTPEQLKEHACLVLTINRDGESWHFKGASGECAIRPQGRIRADSGEAIKRLAIDGCGVAFLSEILVADALRAGQLRRILPQWSGAETGVYGVVPRRPASAAANALFAYLAECWNAERTPSADA
jgi:DNA-binding transcriptional LysR family regulator